MAEVEHILDVDRTTVLRYLRDNVIFGYQLGREWRIPEGELRSYHQQLMDARRKEVRHAASEAEIARKLSLLNMHTADGDRPPYLKIYCSNCAGPVLGKFDLDEDTGNAWYNGDCGYCHQRVSEDFNPNAPVVRANVRVTPAPPTHNPGLDDKDIPF